jgi:transposase
MKNRQKLLSDEHWEVIELLLPPPKRRRDGRGRPPAPNRGEDEIRTADTVSYGLLSTGLR